MESFIDSGTKSESSCEKQKKEQVFQEFKRNSSQMKSLSKIASEHFRLLAKLRSIQNDSALDSDMKYEEVMKIVDQLSKPSQSEENHITDAKLYRVGL